MVLDLISSLSSEDNFVTVLNGTGDSMSSQSNVRRLSLQNARKGEVQATPLKSASMFQVRSIAAFKPGIDLMPSFSSFVVLRVLDLTGCGLGDHSHLNLRDLGSILHLRYLGLAKTGICKVPEEVGKLKFLQVLDLSGNGDVELPSTVINLGRLMCLLIYIDSERIPDGLGNLASMEVLRMIRCDSLSIVKELGGMERLRELGIEFDNWSFDLEEAFVESLGKLSNIQSLQILYGSEGVESMDLLGERWTPPRSLQKFVTTGYHTRFSTLPAWIRRDPSHLSQLSILDIVFEEAGQEDLDSLGKLPALRTLAFRSHRWSGLLLVGADGFRCLTQFFLFSPSPGQIVFQPGAMPRAEIFQLYICIPVRVINEEAVCDGLDCSDLGMGNLPSLRNVTVIFWHYGAKVEEAKQAEAALENALRAHPNRPNFDIRRCSLRG